MFTLASDAALPWYMQTATEAAAGEAADEGEEEDAEADDIKYGLASCHFAIIIQSSQITLGCAVWKDLGAGMLSAALNFNIDSATAALG